MEKKYLIANIQIPMEIFQDGKYESLTDFITVDFIHCSELPNKPSNLNETINNQYNEILKQLFTPHQKDQKDQEDQEEEHQEEEHQEEEQDHEDQEEEQEQEHQEQEQPLEQVIESILKLSIFFFKV